MLFTMVYPEALADAGQFSKVSEISELFRVHDHRTVVPEYGDILHVQVKEAVLPMRAILCKEY